MTNNDALTTILKQFKQTGDIEQAKEDIKSIYENPVEEDFEIRYCPSCGHKGTKVVPCGASFGFGFECQGCGVIFYAREGF